MYVTRRRSALNVNNGIVGRFVETRVNHVTTALRLQATPESRLLDGARTRADFTGKFFVPTLDFFHVLSKKKIVSGWAKLAEDA